MGGEWRHWLPEIVSLLGKVEQEIADLEGFVGTAEGSMGACV